MQVEIKITITEEYKSLAKAELSLDSDVIDSVTLCEMSQGMIHSALERAKKKLSREDLSGVAPAPKEVLQVL